MRHWLALGACLAALFVLALALDGGAGLGGASTLSAGADGWLAARQYLVASGARAFIADVPMGAAAPGGELESAEAAVWVLSFPWPRALEDGEALALRNHLAAGGSVVLAYSQRLEGRAERAVLDALGLDTVDLRGPPPLLPWRWWRVERGEWELSPDTVWGASIAPRLVMPIARRVPEAPNDALVLYRGGDDAEPLVFSFTIRRGGSTRGGATSGRVVALPAALLANAGLPRAGNADLLEILRLDLGEVWRFDEYHHGLVAPEYRTASSARFAWDLFLIHLALFYVLALMALVRRFGPPWREPMTAAGSAADFLRNLAALHRQLGHHPVAARLLAERRRRLDPRMAEPREEVTVPQGDAELVRFAHRLMRLDARKE